MKRWLRIVGGGALGMVLGTFEVQLLFLVLKSGVAPATSVIVSIVTCFICIVVVTACIVLYPD